MTTNGFRAFIEGMDIQGAPTAAQWARIVEKIRLLQDPVAPFPYCPPVVIPLPADPLPNRWWDPGPVCTLPDVQNEVM